MFPKSTVVFAQLVPSHRFATVVLQEGVTAPLHTDAHNAPGSETLLVNLIPCADAILYGLKISPETPNARFQE